MKKVAIVGIVGVPAKYGGFETLAENIIGSINVEYTIFCSSCSYKIKSKDYKGAHLRYLNIKANGIQSCIYDIMSMLKCSDKFDAILILGISGCLFLPFLKSYYHNKIIVNIDGMEFRRQKWGSLAKWILKKSEHYAIKYSDIIISDNRVIQEYVKERYGKDAVLITYGGDHAMRDIDVSTQITYLKNWGLERACYAMAVCRIEPENNCHIILEAFSRMTMKIIFIGNWMKSDYGRRLKDSYSKYSNIMMCDSIYDLNILYSLRNNCSIYIHGHSAGGTNPSLVEAMYLGCNIIAYDVSYNRETTNGQALYFSTSEDLFEKVCAFGIHNGNLMHEIALKEYNWEKIAKQYEELY